MIPEKPDTPLTDAMKPVPQNAPVLHAWDIYKQSADYANTRKWAKHDEHVDGSLWAAFCAGYSAQVEALKRENVKLRGWILEAEQAAGGLQRKLNDAEQRADRACGKLMDEFGIKRCPENYLKIIEILHEYRGVVRRALLEPDSPCEAQEREETWLTINCVRGS